VSAIDSAAALDELRGECAVELYDARFAKPVDGELLESLLRAGVPVITVEDHSIRGGFGACVLEECNRRGLDTRLVTRLGLPDAWIYHGERKEQLAEAGIDARSIARAVRTVVERSRAARESLPDHAVVK
jgi:1-deoxy-D-xylulose-5-phosphate synthase